MLLIYLNHNLFASYIRYVKSHYLSGVAHLLTFMGYGIEYR